MHALVLSRAPRQEYDERLTFLSEGDQLIEAIARGSKKNTSKNSFHLEPGTHIEVEIVQGKEQRYVGSVVPLEDAMFLSTNVLALQALMYATSLVSRVFEERADYQGFYRFFIRWRQKLQRNEGSVTAAMAEFFAFSLSSLGYEPVVNECAHCAKALSEPYFFSHTHGGMICAVCKGLMVHSLHQATLLTSEEFGFLRTLFTEKQGGTPELRSEKIHSLLRSFLEFHLEQSIPPFTPFSL